MLMDLSNGVELTDAVILNRALAGIPLQRVRLPGNVLVLGIRREGEALVPHGDTVLQKGDVMMFVGSRDALHEAKRLLQGLYKNITVQRQLAGLYFKPGFLILNYLHKYAAYVILILGFPSVNRR